MKVLRGDCVPSMYECDCPSCSEKIRYCTACEYWLPIIDFQLAGGGKGYRNRCRDCETIRKRPLAIAWDAKKTAEGQQLQVELTKLLESVQFKPMTEAEWLQTCKFFNGCALCGDSHIEVRKFLINFEKGGSYSVGNVLPMCNKCAGDVELKGSLARYAVARLNRHSKFDSNRLKKIIEYFKKKVSENGAKVESI